MDQPSGSEQSLQAAVAPPPPAQEDRFSFAKFAAHPFFREVNAWLVAHAGIRPGSNVVDLGCGPGAVTELILQWMGIPPRGRVFAIDPSPSALLLAAQRIRSAIVQFIQGTAERVGSLVPPVDIVVFANAIHLVANKAQVIGGVSKILRPGGVFAFNTTFFNGAYPGDTPRFYRHWVLRAVRWLRERGHDVARGVKATAMQWLSPEDYRRLLRESGFDEPEMVFQEKQLTCQAWEDISEFSMFIEGALPGVPLEVGMEALKVGVRQAFEDLRLQAVPRIWLQVVARRT
ncbi:MAG: methyltransferase domain-containing protein [Armatimonadota bacterium]|nr:methyltransferase domain-containing protein [Armatimonadota bacterium]